MMLETTQQPTLEEIQAFGATIEGLPYCQEFFERITAGTVQGEWKLAFARLALNRIRKAKREAMKAAL